MRGKYKLSEKSKEKKTIVSQDQQSSGVTGNIREAILAYDKQAYDGYFGMIEKKSPKDDTIPLHYSFGDGAAQEGHVISFNVAGSSFAQPLRYEKGTAGKNNIFLMDRGSLVHIKKGETGRSYTFTKQDGSNIDLDGSSIMRHSISVVNDTFGENLALQKNDIRVKTGAQGRKTKYSISGPRISIPIIGDDIGALNAGEYKIENTREYIYELGKKHLENLMQLENRGALNGPVNLTFTGHSRGGVGVVEGAMRLKHLVNHLVKQKCPSLVDKIHFNVLLYDPVPGPKSRIKSNINHAVNLKEQTREMKELNMEPFGENDHTTVVYSMGCNHKAGFNPMKVLGADTIILTGHSHDEGLKDTEYQFGEMKRQAYINAQNGEAYRASGLMEMPKGIYISDENNIMVPAKNIEMVESVYSATYTGSHITENTRKRRILEACTDLHMRSGGVPTLDGIIRGFNAHDPFYVISSTEFRTMRKGFDNLLKLIETDKLDSPESVKLTSELRKSALEYVKSKDGKGPHSNRTQGRLNTAKSLIVFLDSAREKNAGLHFQEKLDDTQKTKDMRAGYLAAARDNLAQNQEYMCRMCQRYADRQPVETDMFYHTLSSMMADRYFIRTKDEFMPEPIENPDKQQSEIKKLQTILGDQKNSLYEVFSRSPAVNSFASELISGSQADAFININAANETLDRLISAVLTEVVQNQNSLPPETTEAAPADEKEADKNSIPGKQEDEEYCMI